MSEIEFLRRATQCKEAQEVAVDDTSRAQWLAMAAHWQRLAEGAAEAERRRAKQRGAPMTKPQYDTAWP
jgi:hypothetical protein